MKRKQKVLNEIYNLATDTDYFNVPESDDKYEMAKGIMNNLQKKLNVIAEIAKDEMKQ